MAALGNVLEPAEVGVVMLWDESSGVFRPEAAFGDDPRQMRDMGSRIGEGITSKAFDENVDADLRRMKQVMRNLLDNAIKYSPNGCHVAGTGLGLPVAHAIVKAHGGRI